MTTRDGSFLPSLVLALAAHALLLFLLSCAFAHQVFEAPRAALEVQIASIGPAPAGPAVAPAVKPVLKSRAAPPPAPAAQPAALPRREVLPDEASRSEVTRPQAPAEALRPEVSRPASPAPSPSAPEDSAASLPAGSNAAGAAPGPAAPEAPPAPAAAASPGASVGVGEASTGGPGYESEDVGGGTGLAAFKADINPVLVRSIQVPYPAAARRLGQEGTVRVLVEIGKDGTVISDEVYSSSGYRLLDAAALDAVKKARFLPALKDGRPVIARILVPVRFRLTE